MLGNEGARATGAAVPVAGIDERLTSMAAFPRRAPEPQSVAALMRSHLDTARPRSDAEALRLLRQAFPAAPLAARVAALVEHGR